MSDPNAPTLFRLRVAYKKQGRLAYLGHLEVIHTIERVVRRAGMPYAVTQGFSPHMRIGFTSALPVGTSSLCEYYDLFLTELVERNEALRRLIAASPSDLAPYDACYIDVKTPALTAQITHASYRIELDVAPGVPYDPPCLSTALERLHEQGSIVYLRGRKEKTLDLGRTLASFSVRAGEGRRALLQLETRISNEGALRPEILLAALDRELCKEGHEGPIVSTGIQDLDAISRYAVTRTAQYLEDDAGGLVVPLCGHLSPSAPTCATSVCRTCE